MATPEEIFQNAVALSTDARVELAERLIASLANDISPSVTEAHLAEVRRRIHQVELGETELIPGDKVLAEARRLLVEHSSTS